MSGEQGRGALQRGEQPGMNHSYTVQGINVLSSEWQVFTPSVGSV